MMQITLTCPKCLKTFYIQDPTQVMGIKMQLEMYGTSADQQIKCPHCQQVSKLNDMNPIYWKEWFITNEEQLIAYSVEPNLAGLKKLIVNGVDINYQNSEGQTALMLASHVGNYEIVCALVEAGADINLEENNGWNAYRLACANSKILVATFLGTMGANK